MAEGADWIRHEYAAARNAWLSVGPGTCNRRNRSATAANTRSLGVRKKTGVSGLK